MLFVILFWLVIYFTASHITGGKTSFPVIIFCCDPCLITESLLLRKVTIFPAAATTTSYHTFRLHIGNFSIMNNYVPFLSFNFSYIDEKPLEGFTINIILLERQSKAHLMLDCCWDLNNGSIWAFLASDCLFCLIN